MEILQDTIIQTLFRQGTDSERKTVTLKSGEPGYTNDLKRLFVGDGVTLGGNIVGNLFKGIAADITTLSPAENGDMVYDTNRNALCVLTTGSGSVISDWTALVQAPYPRFIKFNGSTMSISTSSNGIFGSSDTVISKIGVGHYSVSYPTLGSTNVIPNIQIWDTNANPIIISSSQTSTTFQVISGNSLVDSIVSVTVNSY